MRTAARLVVAVLGLSAGLAGAQEPSIRLEALTERIAKLHAQVGQGVLVERSRRALPDAVHDFDTALREVRARPAVPEVRETYVMLALLWTEYRAWALKAPTRDNARKLAERAEEVAWVAAKGARLVHGGGRKGAGLLALDAAHAATLSQRLARLYLLRRWEVKTESSERAAPAVEAELVGTLERLRTSAINTAEIETELQAAQGQLGFLVQAGRDLRSRRAGMRSLEFAAKSADHLFESMQRVMRLYEGG